MDTTEQLHSFNENNKVFKQSESKNFRKYYHILERHSGEPVPHIHGKRLKKVVEETILIVNNAVVTRNAMSCSFTGKARTEI